MHTVQTYDHAVNTERTFVHSVATVCAELHTFNSLRMHLSRDLLLLDILIFVRIKKEKSVCLNFGLQVPKALGLYENTDSLPVYVCARACVCVLTLETYLDANQTSCFGIIECCFSVCFICNLSNDAKKLPSFNLHLFYTKLYFRNERKKIFSLQCA